MSFEVFFSHAEDDFKFVERIFNILKRIQINCYVHELFPQAGEIIQEIIKNKILECPYMIVLLTKQGVKSQWVNQEIGIAHAYGKLIIPIVDDRVDSKGFVEFRQHIKYNISMPEKTISQILYRLWTLFPNKYSLEVECERCGNKNFYFFPEYETIKNAIRKNLWLNLKCYSCDNFNILNPETLEQKSVYDSYHTIS